MAETGSIIETSRREGDTVVASLSGEVDLNNSPKLREALIGLVVAPAPKKLVLNLNRVAYMDSSAIAVLVELLRKVGKGGKIVLTNLQPRVRGILEIARLHEVFKIVADEKAAEGV